MPTKTTKSKTSGSPRLRRTKAQKRASAKNGGKGGRPKLPRDLEDFAELGRAPSHPLKLARWFQQAISICAEQAMAGRGHPDLWREIRQSAMAAGKLIPPDVVGEALNLLRQDREELASDTAGPETESTEDGGWLNIDPKKEDA